MLGQCFCALGLATEVLVTQGQCLCPFCLIP